MNRHSLSCSFLPAAVEPYVTLNTAWMASNATLNIRQSDVDILFTTCTLECDLI